jgi:bifunctional non-homologous end joining protein LigD
MATRDLFDFLPESARRKVRRRAQPEWSNPMLATLTREPFSDPDWLFEPKLDGIRCLAFSKGKRVQLYSRNQLSLNDGFPTLSAALLKQPVPDFIVDGEIVAMKDGVSRFELLQQRMKMHVPTFFYLFDVLYIAGHDVTQLELRYRKELLRRALSFKDPIRFSAHREEDGEAYFREASRKGWEGIIAKRADSIYVHQRSKDWLKFKCENQQEFVIVGYTEPMGQRVGIGALLVGVYENGLLRYAGKVGTGFDTRTLKDLEQKLSAIEKKASPCAGDSLPKTKVHWVQPKLVAQIAFYRMDRRRKAQAPTLSRIADRQESEGSGAGETVDKAQRRSSTSSTAAAAGALISWPRRAIRSSHPERVSWCARWILRFDDPSRFQQFLSVQGVRFRR